MGRLLFDDVDRWAVEAPDATAIRWHSHDGTDSSVTYEQLGHRSNQIAQQLLDVGVEPGARVAICMSKGPDAIAAMLGTTKAGAAYVPLDPDSPPARIALILSAADPQAVVAGPEAGSTLSALTDLARPVPTGTLGSEVGEWPIELAFTGHDVCAHDPAVMPEPAIGPEDLAHILFTSGSTGTPKGVMITHQNVLACIDWATGHFGYDRSDEISGHSPLHFDLSTFDIYTTFAVGATLHPVSSRLNVNPADLARFIRDRRLTQWFSVPSALNHMVRFDVIDENDFPSLRRLIWCGEVLPTPTLIELMNRLPHVEFTNLYGPTEATIASSWYRVPSTPTDPTEPIPIGRPCDGEDLVVLDGDGREAGADEVGELYIEGVGLSPGYWRDEDRTSVAFRSDLLDGRRLYRTGDLARRRTDGQIVFVGRTDTQIKSRGHRIELGEIEAALRTVDVVDDSAVVAVESGGFDGTTICAAFVSPTETKPAAIAKQLGELLPRYMIPQRWRRFDELPRNVNGKIDRPSLRASFEDDRTRGHDDPR